ncbi:ATP-binding protein [Actinoplanes sp. NPDC023936]|uniref:ATP-binding protein n=1 Tax=Actinoplanes sp. NPDC023936 TaxID=3154910 RepID=UPI0033C88C82
MSSAFHAEQRSRRICAGYQDRVFDLVSAYGPDVRRLCQAYPALVPDAAGIGLSAGPPGPVSRFASDRLIAELHTLQDAWAEGPDHDVTVQRRPVQVADLKDSACLRRWPRFTPAALDAGMRAVYALPLHAGGVQHPGAVTLYRHTPGGWDNAQQNTVEPLAAAAAELLTLRQRGLDLTGAFTEARRDDSILLLAAGAPVGPRPGLAADAGAGLPLIRWFQQATPALRLHLDTIAGHVLPDDDRYRFVLAAHEAMTNAVQHGGGHGQLLLWHRDDRLWCEISDHGPGLDRAGAPPRRPCLDTGGALAPGHGLWLIQQAVTSLDITADRTGTRVLLSHRTDQRRPDIDARHAGA